MGITASIVSAGVTGYGIYQQAKAAKNAPTLASLNPPNLAAEQMKADQSAFAAAQNQKTRTANKKGFQSTILTGSQGVPTPPPASSTLLGR